MKFLSQIKPHSGLIFICCIFFSVGLLRLNDLSIYTPDSARYLIFGNSIAQGKGFIDDTQPEIDRFSVQGPFYPIIIASSQLLFPYSLIAAKINTLIWGVLAIIFFYIWVGQQVGKNIALGATLFFALNPLLLVYSSEVLSEAPFLTFIFLTLLLVDRFFNHLENSKSVLALIITSVTATALIREIGIVIIISVAAAFILRRHIFQGILVLFISGLFLGLWYLRNHWWIGPIPPTLTSNYSIVLHHIVTPSDSPLINEFALRLWLNLKTSIMQVGGMILYPLYLAQQFKLALMPSDLHQFLGTIFTKFGAFLVLVLTVPLIFSGIYLDLRQSRAGILRLLFILSYYFLILIYPVFDIRFLLILLPLVIFYCATSILWLIENRKRLSIFKNQKYLIGACIILMIPNFSAVFEILKLNLSYRASPLVFFNTYGQKPNCPIMFTQPWSIIGSWINNNLPGTAIIASPTKNLSVVARPRKVFEIDQGISQPVFETLLRDNQIDYLLSPSRGQDLKVYHFMLLEANRFWFELIYKVANLHLYKVHSKFREPQSISLTPETPIDSGSASYLLETGRRDILGGNMANAESKFKRALTLDSTHPALLYQMIIYHAIKNDSTIAKYYYNKLYSLPQALGYIFPARLELEAMDLLNNARRENINSSRAVGIFNAASLYWNMGYYKRAADILNDFLQTDSMYFTGLLWGLHFNLQVGDTNIAKKYFSILNNIESDNPAVMAFDHILQIGDSLRIVQNPLERSRLHYTIANLYYQIELNEEAIDEAEKALGENSRNIEALILMGDVFKRKNNIRMAKRAYQKAIDIDSLNIMVISKFDSLKQMRLNN